MGLEESSKRNNRCVTQTKETKQTKQSILNSINMSADDFSDAMIVVGAGLSGGSCALTILESGKRVILVEKEKKLGGNSVRASSGYNAPETHYQSEQHVPDTNDIFMHDTAYSSTKDINAVATPLIKTLVKNSASGIDWMESHGIKLPVVSQCGGHSQARTHRPTTGAAGGYITLGLLRNVKKYAKKGRAKIIKKAKMTELIKENGRVVGLKYIDTASGQEKQVKGMGVVIATGGFCYNKEMIREYSPTNVELSTTNGHWANGEGMLVAQKAGAKLVDMACVQVHPTGFIDPKEPKAREKTLAAECLRAAGALLINRDGHRFVNELGHRDDVTSAERGQPGQIRLILNPVAVKEVEPHVRMYTNFFKVLKPYKNSHELAKEMGIDVANLIDSYDTYNESARKGWCPSGKTRFPGVPYRADQELRVGFVEPVLHYVMGGIAIDPQSRALDEEDRVIPGLFSCGEAAGGVHGRNRLAGNSLVECVVYGRVSGDSAVKYMSGTRSKL